MVNCYLSLILGDIRQVGKITLFKPKLALRYSLLARTLAAENVGYTFPVHMSMPTNFYNK